MLRYRYRRIVLFFARLLLGFVYWDLLLPRLGMRKLARRSFSRRLQASARSFRNLAVEMGGVLIKVGQFLSSRVDVLPAEFTEELAGLQDEVPPEAYADIRRVAEQELGRPLEQLFTCFKEQPLAAASLGQVHEAKVRPGGEGAQGEEQQVVVKVQRPNIERIIATDLAALHTVGRWLHRYPPVRRRADVPALLAEFSRILYEEIDYLAEGRNAETFAANFKHDDRVRVPQVIWTHTTKRVLTLENVWAIKITDYEAISAAGVDRAEVASRLLDTYLKQIFEDGFFHADPHPGNLFVYPLDGEIHGDNGSRPWRLTFVDFGMAGRVPPNTKDALREMLIGVGTRDAGRVVKSYQMLGVLLPGADLDLLEKAEAQAFERFWGKDMDELRRMSYAELGEFAQEFRQLIYSMPFQVPQDIIFLARAVGILSGMCTGLNPHFNVWNHLAPYAEKLIRAEAPAMYKIWLDEAKKILLAMLATPAKLDAVLAKIERGQIAVQAPELSRQVHNLETSIRQVALSLVFLATLLGGIQLYLAGITLFGTLLIAISGISFLWVLLSGRRR